MDRALALSHGNDYFFDDHFEDIERKIARLHQDFSSAMTRLAPFDLRSQHSKDLDKKLAQLRNIVEISKDGSSQIKIDLDVSNFKPEEVEVKVKGNQLSVHAKHEEKNDNSRVYHEFHREVTLPAGTDLEQLESILSKDGILSITGPVDDGEPPTKKQAIEN